MKKKYQKESVTKSGYRQKLKDTNIKPWRYFLSIVVFIGALGLLPTIIKGSSGMIDILAWFYIIMASAAVIIDLIQGTIPLSFKGITNSFLSYIFKLFLEVVLLACSIPILVFLFISGPVMAFIFLVSLGGLITYFLVVILGIDIKGIHVTHPWWVAAIEVGAIIVSGKLFSFSLKKGDTLMESYIDKVVSIYFYIVRLDKTSSTTKK